MSLRQHAEVTQRQPGTTVIAHLSDLHFTPSTDLNGGTWSALLTDFSEQRGKFDLVVVTGDIIDGTVRDVAIDDTLNRARDFLHRLCEAAGIPHDCLFVVPGNHDVRKKGIFRHRAQAAAFRNTFREYFGHAFFPKLRLCLFSFDSNTSLSPIELAAGAVTRESLNELAAVVAAGEKLAGWNDCVRVALVHHHPMPIAQHRDAENLEEFLLLRNAGMFMVEMLRRKVDLILHGHKHHPAASKAVYFDDDGGGDALPRWISVVAGGSATAEADRAMYNIVAIGDSGEVRIERRSYSAASFTTRTPKTHLVAYEDARMAKFERLARRPEFDLHLDEMTRLDEILPAGGDLLSRATFVNARSRPEQVLERYEMRFQASTGYFSEPVFDDPRVTWEAMESLPGERKGFAVFDAPLKDSDAFTFTRDMVFSNAIYFSKRDRSDATGKDLDTEDVGINVRYVCDRLAMVVTFPPLCYPPVPPWVIAEYTGSDGASHRDYSEENYARRYLTAIEPGRTFVFAIDRPLPGYRYRIEWSLPTEDPTEPQKLPGTVPGTVREIRKLLSPAGAGSKQAGEWLLELQQEFRKTPVLGAFGAATNDVDLSVFLYEETKRGLYCAASTISGNDPILTAVIAPGRDLVGQAYRRRAPVLYVAESETATTAYANTSRRAVFAVPLFYPILAGRRVGVLSLASSSNVSWLAALLDDEALLQAVTEQITNAWELLLKRLPLPVVLKQ